ncbi:bifunctional [glutamine synthetase] adenylyltransferase/[glutamine synthetase]-adenylyl-L-tyrosine phosphorylase [Siccirubricoccus sp. KC 17139]|uniref:Bifunctional glutamine synthetase adenylyltransferase/adenylyl-removing enzyme n=1 Tax=Siccirubricoccus soli TaxID=2899147 RepID=A0ABT1CYN8_9PROT|nr:bifunctional [glutamine synthetase] adenylyltransferase/[glutamine synthetase]-adenylyl-L-tyrosine phosphorylase [Siccirubricoccus soli]MCO6414788.1 bifunctional [glutamine synthetase] adenylyltransferase/[glutamine synthetase]-adenylyl-L-tyrosine phosphorylase [Siccirubricoccus soli]MCP2680918.1 bifunctional [glutamine synthetase] adenylyltransferase/[glutamine synthetase]-adenylyl-L-tyrosine phosphorylase [Siccirubricoccus soli]
MPSGPRRLPRPFDPDAVDRLVERFAERGDACRAYAASAEGAALLARLGGNSPYLADLAVREAATLLRIAERGPDEAFALALDPLGRADPGAGRDGVAALLRQVKRQGALIVAVADLNGQWALERVTGALSDLADQAIDFAAAHLLLAAAERGELRISRGRNGDVRSITKGSGLAILGMGKLGGRELNYSSDVDLMVLYEPEAAAYHSDRAGAAYVRLARDLVRLLDERTADGYVFRTDLRLRPDPAATPLAVSLNAAITYYESMGQNWERAAMIKARPVAGDRALGEHFLREIRPFVWRRHLDFAAVADIHSIKRQIHVHKAAKGAGATVALAGHDVKLGRGGIREIEFTAQVLQLIWGGRDPALRDPTTLGALAALAGAGKLDRRAAADLADAYLFLRDLEHRLQMVNDRQTHRLPEDAAGLARIAAFMGFASTDEFAAAFMSHLQRVERHYGKFFEAAPALSEEGAGDGGNLVFTGVEDDPETLATLKRLGFTDPPSVAALVRGWHHGRPRATRSARARELLTELMPALLAAFGRQSQPDQALVRFDGVLSRLPAGVQILSLLHRNPAMLDRLAGILGAAPQLANHLARNPAALDGLLAGSLAPEGADPSAALPALVKDARHFEEALEAARRLATERKFEIDAAAFEGTLDADLAGELRADLADSAIAALLPRIAADFAERFGRIQGGAMVVLAMGKLGGREMLPGSDLDLVLLYDHDPEAVESTGGRRSLAPSEYFIRLAPQIVAAITAPGAEGRLWEVDMRLRPSGNKGPVAIRLSSFEQYHQENAWTWERMALTRARPIAGPPALKRRVTEVLRAAMLKPGAAGSALADAAAMRARMLRELPAEGPWDVKAMPGGLIEVEFIAQALQLRHGPEHPEVLATTTRVALARLGKAGILPAEEAAALIAADRLWRTVIGMIRLTVGKTREAGLPAPAAEALLRAVARLGPAADGQPAPVDLPALRAQMQEVAATVRAVFERRIGPLGSMTGGQE